MSDMIIISSVLVIAIVLGIIFFIVLRKKKASTPKTTSPPPSPTEPSIPLWSLVVNKQLQVSVNAVPNTESWASYYLMNVNGMLTPVYINKLLPINPTPWTMDPISGLLTTTGSDGTVLAIKSDSTIVPYVATDSSSYASYDFLVKGIRGLENNNGYKGVFGDEIFEPTVNAFKIN